MSNDKHKLQKHKFTDYRSFQISNAKELYMKILNDNIITLIDHIYQHKSEEPYILPETRVAISMQMILISDKLVPSQISSLIAKDIDTLRKNDEYTSQWANPSLKRKQLTKELELLAKHTEIDDNISLNIPDDPDDKLTKQKLDDFDIQSDISTLNVSSVCPIEEDEKVCTIV